MLRIALAVIVLAGLAAARMVTIDNTKPRLDINGQIIDAHDGSIQRFTPDGPYYYHGVAYGLCKEPANYGCDQTADKCGFRLDHNISVWVSPDLSSGSWVYAGNAIAVQDRPAGTVFRPHAVYNPNTGDYVLWWNYVTPQGQYNGYAVATARTPVGPFTLVSEQVNVTRLKGGAGDFDLFVDYDSASGKYKAYVIYGAAYYMSIEELTDDFIYSTGRQANCTPQGANLFTEYFVEAPVMFKRDGIYYALFGHCCCFCYQGSGILVHTAPSPLGPWTVQAGGDLACKPPTTTPYSPYGAIPTPGQGCLYNNSKDVSVTRSQQNFVIEVQTTTGIEYVWTGDRWQQAPDGIKGHDPQYWVPLDFTADGTIKPVSWVDSFTMDVV
eukprot:m.247211 g.247211  ORF g.247211 m.247211 type:complete len:382 (-) comp15327_c0_seq1:59-1204(-)